MAHRIAYVGNFSQPHCTEVHIAATLEDLGHTVIRLQENGYTTSGLERELNRHKIDLFLFTRTWGATVTLGTITMLKARSVPTASYHLDLYVGLRRKHLHQGKSLEQVLQTDPFWRTDFVFTPDGDPNSAEVFRENGVNHFYIKPGVYKPECYIAPISANQFRPEVIFVGGGDRIGSPNGYGHPEWPYRDELITWLYDTYGDRFKKFGHPQETIRNAELNNLYASAKVVVGDSVCLGFNHELYTSDRLFEATGRGGFLIYPDIKGITDTCFKNGSEVVFYQYGDFDQLKFLIDYYIAHDADREKIRLAGHERTKREHTYHNRLQECFAIMQDRGL